MPLQLNLNLINTAGIASSEFASSGGVSGANASINIVQGNVDSFASYSNTTFATDTNLDTVQGNLTTHASYANSTFATTTYVDNEVANLVNGAPGTLDTLNELAAALGNDANLSVTLTTKINTISSNTDIVGTNLNTFGTYTNTTFATDSDLNTVSSNVDSVSYGLTGANTNINAVTHGLTGANTNIDAITHGLTGANTNIDAITHGLTGANTNIDTVQGNVDSFATYSNTTFATDTNLDIVQDNVDTVQGHVDSFATYSNTTFATDTNLDIVQGNATSFASYANSTFATVSGGDPRVDSVTDNLNTFGSYANTTFATDTNLDIVQGNSDSFASYANTTFSTGSGNTQLYISSNLVSNTALFLEAGNGVSITGNTTSHVVTITTNMSNITSQVIATDGTANSFGLIKSAANANMLLVSLNGLLLNPQEYTISSTTLTLSNSDPIVAGSNVEVRLFDFFDFPGLSASSGGGGSPSYSFVGETRGYLLGGTWGPSGTSPVSVSNGIRKISFSSETSALSTATIDSAKSLPNLMNMPSDGAKVHYIAVSSIDNGDVYAVATASDTNAASLGTNFTEAHPYMNPAYGTSSGSQAYIGGHNSQYPGTTRAETLFKFPFAASASTTEVGEMYTVPGGPSSVYLRDASAYSDIVGSYGWYVGGETSDPSLNSNNERITKVPFSSDTPGADVAELTIYRNDSAALQSTTNGYVYGGNQQAPYIQGTDVIEKFPFASNSPAADIAEATASRRALGGTNHTNAGYISTGFPGSPPFISYQKDILKLPFVSDTSTVNTGNDFDLFTSGNAGTGQV